MASPNLNMIHFLTDTIPNGEITWTYTIGTYLNKTIKADNYTPIDFNPSKIIKWDSLFTFTNFNAIGSSSDDLREMMKTLAFNTVALDIVAAHKIS
jgi:hypothetical protein